jgi:hypothetical protein
MSNTMDDFLKLFGGDSTVDEKQAAQFHERRFDETGGQSIRQQRLSRCHGRTPQNSSSRSISRSGEELGLGSTDPKEMSNDDAARVLNYARTEHPELMRQTVVEKPWFVKAMGNPMVISALTMAAAKLLSNRRSNS